MSSNLYIINGSYLLCFCFVILPCVVLQKTLLCWKVKKMGESMRQREKTEEKKRAKKDIRIYSLFASSYCFNPISHNLVYVENTSLGSTFGQQSCYSFPLSHEI